MTTELIHLILDGKLHQARRLLEQKLEGNPAPSSDIYHDLLYIYSNLEDDTPYETLCQKLLTSDLYKRSSFYRDYALHLLSKEDHYNAVEVITLGMQEYPDDAEINFCMAFVWYMVDDLPKQANYYYAWSYIHEALRNASEYELGLEFYFLRAKIAFRMEKYQEAFDDLLKIYQEFDSQNKHVLALLGDVYLVCGEPESAKKMYSQAIELGALYCQEDLAQCNG